MCMKNRRPFGRFGNIPDCQLGAIGGLPFKLFKKHTHHGPSLDEHSCHSGLRRIEKLPRPATADVNHSDPGSFLGVGRVGLLFLAPGGCPTPALNRMKSLDSFKLLCRLEWIDQGEKKSRNTQLII